MSDARTRREILFLGVAAAASASLGGSVGLRRVTEHELVVHLRTTFAHLVVPDEVLHAYLVDYLRHFEPLTGAFRSEEAWRARVEPFSDEPTFAQRFLMSTDWFPDADATRPLRYVALYDPYVSPCWNPLARLDSEG